MRKAFLEQIDFHSHGVGVVPEEGDPFVYRVFFLVWVRGVWKCEQCMDDALYTFRLKSLTSHQCIVTVISVNKSH